MARMQQSLRILTPDAFQDRETVDMPPDEMPERHLHVESGLVYLQIGRLRIVDAGQSSIKIEIDAVPEMEAELIGPPESGVFLQWIKELSARYSLS